MGCSGCKTPPIAYAMWAEATVDGPGRRRTSDGACPSPEHIKQNPTSDHNPKEPTCDAHAVDVSQSPQFDSHRWAFILAAQYVAASPAERARRFFWLKYIVSFNGVHDIIFDPSVSLTWRLNGTGTEHSNHTHYSITEKGLAYLGPFWVTAATGGGDEPVTPQDIQAVGRYVVNELVVKQPNGSFSGLLTEMVKAEIQPLIEAAKAGK